MTRYRLLRSAVGGLLLTVAGCNEPHLDMKAPGKTRQDEPAAGSKREHVSVEYRLRAIVEELRHEEYTAVGSWAWAMTLCMAPTGPGLSLSDAASNTPHSMKIYHLWAKDAKAYLLADKEYQPTGQIIIKESWAPKEIAAEEAAISLYAERGGKKYKPDKPSDLFIMFKDDPAAPGTDDGWVYGIVTPDGEEVISSGRIKACVDCHRQARHDRVFGEKPRAE